MKNSPIKNPERKSWRFLDTSPHSPGGKKPFIGGARQAFNSGVTYKIMNSSVPTVKSFRVLDKMPKNLYDVTEQEELHSMMKATFHKKSESVKGQKSFDAQSLGFEQPAQTQLSRISKKLDRWENQAKLASEQKMQRDIWAKEILKKEEKKEQKMEKMFEQKQKLKRQEWKDHNEKREERIFKYNNDIKVEQKEIWQGVKAYYKEVKAFHKAKQEEEKKIYAKMMETYDAYKGTKA
jgi:hypothetical protein